MCNPHSGRNRRHLEAIRRIAEQQAALFVYHEATTPEAVVETLRAFHAEGVELIAVAGGDGESGMPLREFEPVFKSAQRGA